MLRAVLRLGLERGMRSEAVFLDGVQGRPWIRDIESDGITVRFIEPGGFGALLDEDPGPTVLHVHFSPLQIEAARAGRAHPNTTVYWHVRTVLEPGPRVWLRNQVRFRLFTRGVQEIICVSPHLADAICSRGAPRSRVTAMTNGIDLDRFRTATAEERRAARELLGLPADARVLAHFGRDWQGKGGDLYAGAVRRIADRFPGLIAVTAGAGEEADAAAAELGLEGVLRRIEPTNNVQDVYRAADVFVSPSRGEGGAPPFAVAEALACGTAVAGSTIPGQQRVGHLGAVELAPLEAEPLGEAIASLLERSPERVAADAAGARAWLEANMDVRVWAERVFERYRAAGVLESPAT